MHAWVPHFIAARVLLLKLGASSLVFARPVLLELGIISTSAREHVHATLLQVHAVFHYILVLIPCDEFQRDSERE